MSKSPMFEGEQVLVNDKSRHGLRRLYIVSFSPINQVGWSQPLPGDRILLAFERVDSEKRTSYHLWLLWRDAPEAPPIYDDIRLSSFDWRPWLDSNWPVMLPEGQTAKRYEKSSDPHSRTSRPSAPQGPRLDI